MSSRKNNRRGKKGKVPSGPSDAIDGNISDHERANSDAQSEIEILKKENEGLKKELETSKMEQESLKNEIQEVKNDLSKSLIENKQLKQEKEKLMEVLEKSGNLENRILESSEMEVEDVSFIEDTSVSTENVLENQKPTDADTADDHYLQKAHPKLTMDLDSPGIANEDWSESEPNKESCWESDKLGGKDNASGWGENITEESPDQGYDVACGGQDSWNNQSNNHQKQKYGGSKQSYSNYDNKGKNDWQSGKGRRDNDSKFYHANKQISSRRPHGGQDSRHGDLDRVYATQSHRWTSNDPGDKQEDHFDVSWRGNDRQYRNRKREGNQHRYDKNKEYYSKSKIVETDGDLFSAPKDHSLAHCVAADLRMGSGIAVQFKQQFKNVGELAGQRRKVGQVAVLEEEGRYIYYLITKKFSTGKPRLSDLKDSLEDMKKHVEKNQVKNIAVPRLGCGLDRLNWKDVRQLLQEIFADVDVTITVYNFTIDMQTSSNHLPKKTSKGLYISDHLMRLVNIERDTLIVLFGSECGYVDETMQELDEKFRFINDYKAKDKKLGDTLELRKGGEIICILIVKKHKDVLMSYPALEECLRKLKKIFKNNQYRYMGLQAFMEDGDDLTVAKIVTLLKTVFVFTEGEAWVCWPEELRNVYEDYLADTKERDKSFINFYEK